MDCFLVFLKCTKTIDTLYNNANTCRIIHALKYSSKYRVLIKKDIFFFLIIDGYFSFLSQKNIFEKDFFIKVERVSTPQVKKLNSVSIFSRKKKHFIHITYIGHTYYIQLPTVRQLLIATPYSVGNVQIKYEHCKFSSYGIRIIIFNTHQSLYTSNL